MKRLIFPAFNAFVAGVMFALVGYYLFNIGQWVLVGAVLGLAVGLAAEFGLKVIGERIYLRRVTLVVLVEIPLIVFAGGPYGYALAQTAPAPVEICCSPADYGAAHMNGFQEVRIPGADGVTLAGWFVPPAIPGMATVLVLHGSGGNRTGSIWHADRLAAAGYGVLVYDQRALGESTGEYQSIGWADGRDLPYILDYLSAQPGVDPKRFGGVGLSLGAQILVNAGPGEPRLKALWLDGMGANQLEDLPVPENFAERFILFINRLLLRAVERMTGETAPPGFKTLIPQLEPRAYILIVGGLDPLESRINQVYAPRIGPHGEMWVIPDAYHVGGPGVIPVEYTTQMLAFFAEGLE